MFSRVPPLLSRCFSPAAALSLTRSARPAVDARSVRSEHCRFHDRRDTNFVLYELEGVPREDDGDAAAVIDSCEQFVAAWGHLDTIFDRNPPNLVPADQTEDGRAAVVCHSETQRFVDAFRESGFAQLDSLGLSFPVQCAALYTLNASFSSNILGLFVLTRCAADLLEAHGSPQLQEAYLPKLRSAEWTGTMALSEPHAGSSLAGIRTLAVPHESPCAAPGEYRIRGDKMWTTCAFHDLTDNIVHMLLARTPGAKEGALSGA